MFESLTDEQKAALAAKGEAAGDVPAGPDLRPVLTAFVSVLNTDGTWMVTTDLTLLEGVVVQRPAGADDLVAASAIVIKDVTAQQTAGFTQALMMQTAQQMQQMQQNAQIAAAVSGKGGFKAGRR